MTWAKIDDGFAFHPKVLAVGNCGAGAFVRMLAWSSAHLTDGEIPAHVAELIAGHAGAEQIDNLVRAGLVERVNINPGDVRIPDFLDFNPPKEKVLAERKAARERMAKRRRSSAERTPKKRRGSR